MDPWKPDFRAPLNLDVEVLATDGIEEFRLAYRRTEEGWINSKYKTPLPHRLRVLAWRERKQT